MLFGNLWKIHRLFLFSLCFSLLYFGFWRCSVYPGKTIRSAWIARLSLRYCNFFPHLFFMRDAFFGQLMLMFRCRRANRKLPWFGGQFWEAAFFSPLILRFGARLLCWSKVATANEMWRLLKCPEPCSLGQRRHAKSEADVFKREPRDPWRSRVFIQK